MKYAIIAVAALIMLGTTALVNVNELAFSQHNKPGMKINKMGAIISTGNFTKCTLPNVNPPSSIAISTDRRNYIVGDVLQIFIYVRDTDGCAISRKVNLTLSNTDRSHTKFEQSVYSDPDPGYDIAVPPSSQTTPGYSFLRSNQFALTHSGSYLLTATLVNGTARASTTLVNGAARASTTFEVVDIYNSTPARILYITTAFFAGLLIVIASGMKLSYALSEILRFICISGIIFSVIFIFIFIDEPIGGNGPVGLVKKSMNSSSTSPQDWVINIGGTSISPSETNAYTTGLQIPIYVVIFGIVGGYLRYLYKTSKLGILDKASQEDIDSRRRSFYRSLEDLSLLFLSPLLAIAIWFVLSQWTPTQGRNNVYILAAVSFTVGLVTDEIVQFLIKLTESILRVAQKEEEKPVKDGKHTHTPS
jgi:hypothetical protein